MTRYRVIAVVAALFVTAAAARAQRWGGSPAGRQGSSESRQTTARAVSAASPNGTPSKWGGSPVDARTGSHSGMFLGNGTGAYIIPAAVAAPTPVVPVIAPVDPGCPPVDASVVMPVIHTQREPKELTTIEVYRLQPRFRRYQQP
jgi:hypothetical protein